MTDFARVIATSLCCVCLVAGCGGEGAGKAPTLAPVTGQVTYKGSPLAGATVTFLPTDGPLAMAVTDLRGEFKLASGALPGCAVGRAKVAVSAVPPGESSSPDVTIAPGPATNPVDMEAQSKKMSDMTKTFQSQAGANKSKSFIPERYNEAKSSGLSFTVEPDGEKNKFKIELID
jgi:hypothetical protein